MRFININQNAVRSLQIAHFPGNIDNIHHAAANYCHLAVISDRGINYLLDAVHVRRERCDNNAVLSITEFLIKGFAYHLLAGSKARALSIGAVCQKAQHTTVAVFGKFIKLHHLSVNRSMVNLKVACMDNHTDRRSNGDSNSIRNAVVYTDKVKLEGTCADLIARLDGAQFFVADAVFLETALQNTQSKCGTINGTINLLHHIG